MRWSPRCKRFEWHFRFALFPTRMTDGTWVWLERYHARRIDVGHMWPEYEWERRVKDLS